MLTENQAHQASVHFLVNMLEAYYFADTQAVNAVLGTDLDDFEGDVETIRNPKSEVEGPLSWIQRKGTWTPDCRAIECSSTYFPRADACCSLRTILAWSYTAIEEPDCEIRPLLDGCHNEITKGQIDALRARVN